MRNDARVSKAKSALRGAFSLSVLVAAGQAFTRRGAIALPTLPSTMAFSTLMSISARRLMYRQALLALCLPSLDSRSSKPSEAGCHIQGERSCVAKRQSAASLPRARRRTAGGRRRSQRCWCPHDGRLAACLLHHRGQRAAVIVTLRRHCGGEKLSSSDIVVGLVLLPSPWMDSCCNEVASTLPGGADSIVR